MKASLRKIRIDHLLVQRGVSESRQRAQALILAGQVLVDDRRVDKASQCFDIHASIRLKGRDHPFVSRGGVKLQDALNRFGISAADKVCLDVGASTGGFTDCLLQGGAKKVYTLDSGTRQLDHRLRQDPRVIARENFNARYLQSQDVPEAVELIVVDVSFISVKLILPALLRAVPGPWQTVILVKPQFEAEKGQVGKKGLIKNEALQLRIVDSVARFIGKCGLNIHQIVPAALKGATGNQEYFIAASRSGESRPCTAAML